MSDLISRQVAITIPITPKEDREYQTYNLDDAYEQAWEDLQKKIEQLPSVDAIPIEWIKNLQTRYLEAECYMSVCVVNEIRNLWRKEND